MIVNGVRHITVGGGSKRVDGAFPDDEHRLVACNSRGMFVEMRIDGPNMQIKGIDASGRIIDSFEPMDVDLDGRGGFTLKNLAMAGPN